MQCYNYYALFSLSGLSFHWSQRFQDNLLTYLGTFMKKYFTKKGGLPKVAYLEMVIAILVPKVS